MNTLFACKFRKIPMSFGVLLVLLALTPALNNCKEDPKEEVITGLPDGWKELAPLPVPRNKHAAALLPDGRILICGGNIQLNGVIEPTRTCEIYDPLNNTWQPTGSMNHYRVLHNIVPLSNGKILVWGGYDEKAGGAAYLRHGELYDPLTGLWTVTPNAVSQLGPLPALVKWSNDKVSILGFSSVSRYHPNNNTVTLDSGAWHYVSNMSGTSVCYINDSTRLLIGGDQASGSFYTRLVYGRKVKDALSNGKHTWTNSILMPNGNIMVMGGYSSVTEIYDTAANRWTAVSRPAIPFFNVSLFHDKPNRILAFGDIGVSWYDISGGTWTSVPVPGNINWGTGRDVPVIRLKDGSYWICGGSIKAKIPTELISRTYLFKD